MTEAFTDAAQMAREAGISGRTLRHRLRQNLVAWHTRGSWRVVIGSEKHQAMVHELEALLRER